MLVLKYISVINNLKGKRESKNKWWLSGKRINNNKDNKSAVKIPSSDTMEKIILRHIIELFGSIQPPLSAQSPDQPEPKEWWCWPFLTLMTLTKVNLCPNSLLNSPLLRPPYEYACNLVLKFSQFCCSRRHCFEKDLQCSPYLLQVINPSFSYFWLGRVLGPPTGEPSFPGTVSQT